MGEYFFLVSLAKQSFPELDVSKYTNLFETRKVSSWECLTALREHLQSHGRLRQAFLLLELEEICIIDTTVREEGLRSFIAACDKKYTTLPVWWLLGKANLLLAATLGLSGKREEGKRGVDQAKSNFSEGLVVEPHHKIFLDIQITELKLQEQEESTMMLAEWTSFANLTSTVHDRFLQTTALQQAIPVAAQLFLDNPNTASYDTFVSVWLRCSELLQQLGDIYTLARSRFYADAVAASRGDHDVIVSQHNDFDRDNPSFQIWNLQILATERKIAVHTMLQHHDKVSENLDAINKLVAECAEFWGDVDMRQEENTSSSMISGHVVHLNQENQSDVGEHWYTEWSQDICDYPPEQGQPSAGPVGIGLVWKRLSMWKTLLRWIRKDFKSEELSKDSVESILGVQGDSIEQGVSDLLNHLTPESFAARLLGSESPVSTEHWIKSWEFLLAWLLDCKKHKETKRHYLLCLVQESRIESVQDSKNESSIVEFERYEKLMPQLCSTIQTQRFSALPSLRNAAACAKMIVGNPVPEEQFPLSEPLYQEILHMFQRSLEDLQKLGLIREEASTHVLIAILNRQHAVFYSPAEQSTSAGDLDLFRNALDHVQSAEITYLRAQESYNAFEGWEAIERVRLAAEDDEAKLLFPLAISILSDMPSSEDRDLKLWIWMQKSKAQGLTRLIGPYSAIERFQGVIQEAEQASQSNDSLISEEQAAEFDLAQLHNLSKITCNTVVFIEWYCHSTSPSVRDKILAAAVRPGQKVKIFTIGITLSEVDSLVERLFSGEEKIGHQSEFDTDFQKLTPLLEPLMECSNPGDTLVLIPSGILHRIPLHALKVNNEILICRNPIVYSSSISMLLINFHQRTSHEEEVLNSTRPWQAAVFGDPALPASQAAASSVAARLRVSPNHFTRTAFASSLLFTSLVHYHGQATFQPDAPLDQSLAFSDASLSARDIFDLGCSRSRKTSYHATLLGCSSNVNNKDTVPASRTNNASGGLFGLVPAFQYTGAASTVSSLWELDPQDAALFSAHFYHGFEGAGQAGLYIDLARRFQAAVLEVRREREWWWHWAGFVLGGWWLFRDPWAGEEEAGESGVGGEEVGGGRE